VDARLNDAGTYHVTFHGDRTTATATAPPLTTTTAGRWSVGQVNAAPRWLRSHIQTVSAAPRDVAVNDDDDDHEPAGELTAVGLPALALRGTRRDGTPAFHFRAGIRRTAATRQSRSARRRRRRANGPAAVLADQKSFILTVHSP